MIEFFGAVSVLLASVGIFLVLVGGAGLLAYWIVEKIR